MLAILFLVLLGLLLISYPGVQTRLAHRITESLNKKYHTDIQIDKIALDYKGRVQIKGLYAKDQHKDTIIYIENLKTSIIEFERLKKGKPRFNNVYLNNVTLKLKTYKGQTESAFDQFIKKLEGEPTTEPSGFVMTIRNIQLQNARFRLFDLNDQLDVVEAFDNINAEIKNFKVEGPNVEGLIRNLSLTDKRGLVAQKMDTDFTYSKTGMGFKNTLLETSHSFLTGDILMSYKEGQLSDFNNNVHITADLKQADLAMEDLQKFYPEFGTTDVLHLTSSLNGTLNDFTLQNLDLYTDQEARLTGDYRFINAFDKEKPFKLDAHIDHLESDYRHLSALLPQILGDKLPSSLEELGHFNVKGRTKINGGELDAFIVANTDLGTFDTDLIINDINNIDQSGYDGDLRVQDLKIGKLINDPLIGNITMDATVTGKGFSLKDLDTKIDAKIHNYQYKGYTYSDIDLHGNVKNKKFIGQMESRDPNLKMTFDGIADLSKENYVFDFIACVDYAEFKKLNLFTRDEISVLKGDIKVDMVGNTLENMQGTIEFRSANYINEKNDYFFEDFTIDSKVIDGVQHIDINSTDVVDGTIIGKFKYAELPKLAQNAIGSIYANYKPYTVSAGQYLDFKFNIYNQAVAVFFPEVKLGTNTFIRGEINADEELFKLTFRSPEVLAYDNYFEKIRLQIDNKNPLFNTQLSLDKLKTKVYEISDFNLVNMTLNDTLYFRTEFNGGVEKKDKYNLAFYHTIADANRSVITLQKSDITFNGTQWDIDPNQEYPNSIVFDPHTKTIEYHNFHMVSNGQALTFYGSQSGSDHVNYNIDLDRIKLEGILPHIEDFAMTGIINGGIWIEKRNNMLIPKADVQLLDFTVNGELQGDLLGEIKGGKNNKEYLIDMYMGNGFTRNLAANGRMDFNPKDPMIYMLVNFNDFKISPLNALGKGVIENIRGTVSGEAGINGKLQNPVFSGDLLLNQVGVYFPFINVDYSLDENSHLYLENQSFVFNKVTIFDTKNKTKGTLNGRISHRKFEKWALDAQIETENLLALDMPEEENALFYGTGYLNGAAYFTGDFDNINIAVSGSSNPGTRIVIPMSDLKTVETSRLIHFKTPQTKTESESEMANEFRKKLSENLKGLTMNFDFDINRNAEIEIVIDKTSGSFLKGTGRGNILMDIDTKGNFNMYGDYVVDKGIYQFKYGYIINKPFTVKSGGTISFNGDPYRAELDIEAVYNLKANPKVILPEYNSNKNIPVELNTHITGELFSSSQTFDISIPNAGLDVASELDFILNKQESDKVLQFVSLLAFGNFVNTDNTNYLGSVTNDVGKETISSVTNTVSKALMELFSDPSDKIKFGIDYKQGNQSIEDLYTENQLGVSFSTRLGKNENIIINGEVNVPTGSQSNANIAGTVSAELPLNKKENLFLRMFNRQNEIQYSDEEEGYTQGVGLSYQFEFDKIKDKKKKKAKRKAKNTVKSEADVPKETEVQKDNDLK